MLYVYMGAPAQSFGARLRARRNELKLTQSALAKLAGTTRQSVGNWETERWGISPEALGKLAAALDITPEGLHPDPSSLRPEGGGIGRPKGNPVAGSHESRISALEVEIAQMRSALEAHDITLPEPDALPGQGLREIAERDAQQSSGPAGKKPGQRRTSRES